MNRHVAFSTTRKQVFEQHRARTCKSKAIRPSTEVSFMSLLKMRAAVAAPLFLCALRERV
eukprot:3033625-Amphidinium_carterae.1